MTERVSNANGLPLGERIKRARKEEGLTVATLASALDVDPRTINSWQSGRSRPSYERLVALSRLLKRPPSYFVDEEAAVA